MDSRPATVESESTEDKQRGKESSEKDSARFSKHAGLSEKRHFLSEPRRRLRIITVRGGLIASSLQVME